MKSIIRNLSLFIVLTLILPIVANATGGISVSTRSISIEPNGTKTFSISASNATGRVDISSSDSSIAAISSTSVYLDNDSANITVTGKRAGTATITVTATDMGTYDMEEVKTSYTITVNVTNSQTTTVPTTKAATPAIKKSTVKITAKKKTTTARKTTKSVTTTKPVVDGSTTTTETTTVLVTEEAKENPGNDRKGNIKLDEFKVVGYELKKENDKYILNIDRDINEIYVLASSKDETVSISGAGVVDIKAKNRIVVEVNKDGVNDKYIIKIQKKQDNSIIIIAALIIIIVGMLIYFIIDWKRNKSYLR